MFSKVILKFDSASVTSHHPRSGVTTGVCQLQEGSMTMTSVVQYAFMELVYPGGKGTRYSY
jgi:hypothetical protein